jgi:hypothetical protein
MSSSGVICTVKLDPFYQAFLFQQFGYSEHVPVFAFPKGHDLSLRFQFYLSIPPRSYKGEDHGAWTFKIEVPFMEYKNPNSYRYISAKQQGSFQKRIRSFWQDVSHEIIGKSKRAGFLKEEIIQQLIDEFNFSEEHRDRIRREYSRYLQTERNRRFKKQKQLC